MASPFSKSKQSGFSMIELMAVVAIIGVLMLMVIPKFGKMTAKARQAEAKTNLSAMYTLQESYFAENIIYAPVTQIGRSGANTSDCSAANDIGFTIVPCGNGSQKHPHYAYSAAVGGNQLTFTGTATSLDGDSNGVLPGCATADVWTVDQDRNFLNTTNALSSNDPTCN